MQNVKIKIDVKHNILYVSNVVCDLTNLISVIHILFLSYITSFMRM